MGLFHSRHSDPAGRTRWSPEVHLTERVAGVDLYGTLGARTPAQPSMGIGPNPFYTYHPADIFYPGAGAWVLDQKFETPLMCTWGNGTLLAPNRGMPVFGGVNGEPPNPVNMPMIPRVATPWGAGSPGWSPNPLGNAPPIQIEATGQTSYQVRDWGTDGYQGDLANSGDY